MTFLAVKEVNARKIQDWRRIRNLWLVWDRWGTRPHNQVVRSQNKRKLDVMCLFSDIGASDLASGLFGALIGALVGYRTAIAAIKLSERNTALAEFKKSIAPFIRQIKAEEQTCPSETIEQCIAESEVLFQNCASMLRFSDRKQLTKLWGDFKFGDQPDRVEGDTLLEYFSEANWKSVRKNRQNALQRLGKIIRFQIKA